MKVKSENYLRSKEVDGEEEEVKEKNTGAQ